MNYKIQKHKRHHLVYTTSTRLLPGALYSLHKSSPPLIPIMLYILYCAGTVLLSYRTTGSQTELRGEEDASVGAHLYT